MIGYLGSEEKGGIKDQYMDRCKRGLFLEPCALEALCITSLPGICTSHLPEFSKECMIDLTLKSWCVVSALHVLYTKHSFLCFTFTCLALYSQYQKKKLYVIHTIKCTRFSAQFGEMNVPTYITTIPLSYGCKPFSLHG